jgi:carbonic anhydrase
MSDTASPEIARPATPAEALSRLKEGNARFAAGNPLHPNRSVELRHHLADGQAPYVAVLTCADSRVTPELVFDCGIGELFVCRVAGNVAEEADVASLAFAVEALGSLVVLVMGHTRCGAVKAAVDVSAGRAEAGELSSLTDPILPAVAAAAGGGATGDQLVDAAVAVNVRLVLGKLLASSPILAAAEAAGTVQFVGGVLDLYSGDVTLLSD